jgi:tetratricopeptide (TPR) repeat protein
MSDPGYIYILINPSIMDVVKIGKTGRDPEDRANELSSATGVPTPFYLAYKAYFQDITQAENFVHSRLEQFRVSSNREFFRIPLHKAIDTVQIARELLENKIELKHSSVELDNFLDKLNVSTEAPKQREIWQGIYEMADNYYEGHNETLQDFEEALALYKKAANLGCDFAYWKIGRMYYGGQGCRQDRSKALEYFKEGIRHADDRCWPEMAIIFFDEKHDDNQNKCWRKYFESNHFRDNIVYGDKFFSRGYYTLRYLQQMSLQNKPFEFSEYWLPIAVEVIAYGEFMAEHFEEEGEILTARAMWDLSKKIETLALKNGI